MTGVILSGGQSKRMGQNKSLMPFGNSNLIEHVLERLSAFTDEQIIIGDPSIYGHLGMVHADIHPGKGPLAGLHSALTYSTSDLIFVVGCDMPNINGTVLDHLANGVDERYSAFVPRHDGMIEPLCAIYHKNCLDAFARCLDKGILKMSEALDVVQTKFVPVGPGTGLEDLGVFKNLNTPQDTEQ